MESERRLESATPLVTTGWADEVLWFAVSKLGLLTKLESLKGPSVRVNPKTGKETKRRDMYSALTLNIAAFLMVLLQLPGGSGREALADPHWMQALGFTLEETERGSTRRSERLTGRTRQGAGGTFVEADESGPRRARLDGPRGAFSIQTVSGHLSELAPSQWDDVLNDMVQEAARVVELPVEVDAVLDCTDIETTATYEGAGRVTRRRKVIVKGRRSASKEVLVYGFKVWALYEVRTGIPLATWVDRIEKPDNTHVRAVIEQALKNLGRGRTLRSVALDRGFMDGELLHWLYQTKHIRWYCPSKSKMDVTVEARQRVEQALAKAAQRPHLVAGPTPTDPLVIASTLAKSGRAVDGVRFFERPAPDGNHASLLVAQVDDLTATGFYHPAEQKPSAQYQKERKPIALYATVVLRWPDRETPRTETTRETGDDEKERAWLPILSPEREPALQRYDRYDARSLIENRLFREAKQRLTLTAGLARNSAAVTGNVYLNMIAMVALRAIEAWAAAASAGPDRRAELLGLLRYRQQAEARMRNKVLLVVDGRYGLFDLAWLLAKIGFTFEARSDILLLRPDSPELAEIDPRAAYLQG